jgi:pilus assembly protein CpaE
MAEVATGKFAVPFMTLSNMVLSHASDDGAAVETKGKVAQVPSRWSAI